MHDITNDLHGPKIPAGLRDHIKAMDMLIDHDETVGRPRERFHLGKQAYEDLQAYLGMKLTDCRYRGCQILKVEDR